MSEPIELRYGNELSDHLTAQRLYYDSTMWSKTDKVVAVVLILTGIISTALAGAHWWTLIWLPLAVLEWFHLLSLDSVRTRIQFNSNPKFKETYTVAFSNEEIHFKTVSIDSR